MDGQSQCGNHELFSSLLLTHFLFHTQIRRKIDFAYASFECRANLGMNRGIEAYVKLGGFGQITMSFINV